MPQQLIKFINMILLIYAPHVKFRSQQRITGVNEPNNIAY